MSSLRFGSAVSALALAGILAGCAGPSAQSASAVKGAKANLAYGLRAQMALESGDVASAVDLAEKAAQSSPKDATIRLLLGNAYFASGRFASAEAAYGDALTLAPNDPGVILKRSLVQIAQGKNGEALAQLGAARGMIESADYGLALALAGQPAQAIEVLESAARADGADSRVRQNLALAYALSGDWTSARTIAAQDLPADQLEARVQQWMSLVKPARASDQVAALVGVSPAVADPGQPVQLALNSDATRYAAAAAPQQVAQAAAEAPATPAFAEPVTEPPVAVAQAKSPAPVVATEQQKPSFDPLAAVASVATEAKEAVVSMASNFVSTPQVAAAPRKASARAAAAPRLSGNSKAVVQLGAYRSSERVSLAWAQFVKKYPALANYSPVRARYDSAKGTVWRLSVQGFGNQREAQLRCQSLRSQGGNCFVRTTAGDAPVQFASR
jgi:D-alanyl-D-alanine carboxypeptidase